MQRFISIPVFSEILQNRIFSVAIVITACIQTGLVALGLNGWPCPFRTILGLYCPGCGLSTAAAHLLRGNWIEAVHVHAFAPVILLGVLLMAGVCLLPDKYYFSAVQTIEKYEKISGLIPILLVAMILYWGVRVVDLL